MEAVQGGDLFRAPGDPLIDRLARLAGYLVVAVLVDSPHIDGHVRLNVRPVQGTKAHASNHAGPSRLCRAGSAAAANRPRFPHRQTTRRRSRVADALINDESHDARRIVPGQSTRKTSANGYSE